MSYIIKNQAVLEKSELSNIFKEVDNRLGLDAGLLMLGSSLEDRSERHEEFKAVYSSYVPDLHIAPKKAIFAAHISQHPLKKSFMHAEPQFRRALGKSTEKEIEEIIADKWRYLVMNFGGEFLTEIRPDKCFIHNERLSDNLVLCKNGQFSLNFRVLEEYLSRRNGKGLIQIHLPDIILNPKTKDYDIFSITSGDLGKADLFLDLAEFLNVYNKGKESVIPVHLPYYEEWKTSDTVRKFGSLGENGKRDACFLAEKVLRHLEGRWKNRNIKLALENGFGECRINGNIIYALVHEPYNLKFLKQGRDDFVTLCEDVGHLNLLKNSDWTEYLTESIGEFHVSGNNGIADEHVIATPGTLKNYHHIMSFLKFFSGNICTEMKRGDLTIDEFVKGVKGLVTTLFTKPDRADYSNLAGIEKRMKKRDEKINRKNLNQVKYKEYKKSLAAA